MISQDDLRSQLREALAEIKTRMIKLNGVVEDIESGLYDELTWIEVGDAKSLAIRLELLLQDLPDSNE